MHPTYSAILRNGQLEWGGLPPVLPEGPIAVQVTILPSAKSGDGQAMATALEAQARIGGPSSLADPEEWQREVRVERPLPGREG